MIILFDAFRAFLILFSFCAHLSSFFSFATTSTVHFYIDKVSSLLAALQVRRVREHNNIAKNSKIDFVKIKPLSLMNFFFFLKNKVGEK